MAAGRKPKYRPEFAEKLIEHFDIPAFEVLKDQATGEPILSQSGKPSVVPCKFPTLASFACEIRVHRETLINWSEARYPDDYDDLELAGTHKYPEFFEAYKIAKEHQERILTQGGLSGVFQGNFAIFTAKNVIGWRDVKEHKHDGEIDHKHSVVPESVKSVLDEIAGFAEDLCDEASSED